MKLIVNSDGGARGNPGPAAIGVVIKGEDNSIVKEIGTYLGITTNNEAEYKALIAGLNTALELNGTVIDCFLDSELVVKQLNGLYKVKHEKMQVYWASVKKLESNFEKVTYTHIPREQNKEADKLVNQVLDSVNNNA